MPLELVLNPGGLRLALREATLERALGGPVRVRCTADLPGPSAERDALARTMSQPGVTMQALVHDAPIASEGVVVAVEWPSGSRDKLDLEAIPTHWAPFAPNQHPLMPRSRVHRANSLKALVEVFKPLATLSRGVEHELAKIRFGDEEKACVIQEGLCDWEFLRAVLGTYPYLAADGGRRCPVLSGSVHANTEGLWTITWADKEAYEKQNDIASRKVEDTEFDEFEFGTLDLLSESSTRAVRQCRMVSRLRQAMPFDQHNWDAWRKRDAPMFWGADEILAFRIRDRIYRSNADVLWSTAVDMLPDDEGIPASTLPPMQLGWLGLGEVAEHSGEGPWIEVKLDGFGQGEDTVAARVSTPYSGADGHTGLHLVPEQGTRVLLAWSGIPGSSVVCLGNVRDAAAQLVSPSLELGKELLAKLQAVGLHAIGKTTVGSDYQLTVAQNVELTSTGTFKISAQGHNATFQGGMFQAGQ